MFEIGNSVREARLRQGLEIPQVEADTKIRAKYLQALEEERFELLPAETYVKGFLRTYAEYLGLDGQLYVDEFNSRFAAAEEPIVAHRGVRRTRPRVAESNFVVAALAGIVAVTVLVVVAWQFGAGGGRPSRGGVELAGPPAAETAGAALPEAEAPAKEAEAPAAKPKVRTARLVLKASRGDCWLSVRAGSATGELLFEGTLEQGESMRFAKRRLWIQLGAPENLDAILNGKKVTNFPQSGSVVAVTAKGVRVVATI